MLLYTPFITPNFCIASIEYCEQEGKNLQDGGFKIEIYL